MQSVPAWPCTAFTPFSAFGQLRCAGRPRHACSARRSSHRQRQPVPVQAQFIDHAFGQYAAFEQLQLRAHGRAVVHVGAGFAVLAKLHHARRALVHLDGGGRQVQGRFHKAQQQRRQQPHDGHRHQQPLVLEHHAPDVAQVQHIVVFPLRRLAIAFPGRTPGMAAAHGQGMAGQRSARMRGGQLWFRARGLAVL